jgi:hypothetical protein
LVVVVVTHRVVELVNLAAIAFNVVCVRVIRVVVIVAVFNELLNKQVGDEPILCILVICEVKDRIE